MLVGEWGRVAPILLKSKSVLYIWIPAWQSLSELKLGVSCDTDIPCFEIYPVLCGAGLSRSVMSSSFRPHGLQPARLLWPQGFSRWEYWRRLPCSPPGSLPNIETEPGSPALQADSSLYEPPGKPKIYSKYLQMHNILTWECVLNLVGVRFNSKKSYQQLIVFKKKKSSHRLSIEYFTFEHFNIQKILEEYKDLNKAVSVSSGQWDGDSRLGEEE